jgi:hypothetical protein
MFSPRAAENQETVHLKDALVYTGGGTFSGARKRKRLLGQSPSPEKAQCGWPLGSYTLG